MNAEIKMVHSPDVNISIYEINSPEVFNIYIQVGIGPSEEESYEVFGFDFCSPEWIAGQTKNGAWVSGRHKIIVCRLNFEVITSIIKELLSELQGDTWKDYSSKIARHGAWEFEDYTVLG